MAGKRTRRRFTAEFEARAVERLLEGGRGLAEAAPALGPGLSHPGRGEGRHGRDHHARGRMTF